MSVENFYERTRAFIKIQDGCNRFCSYCIIPYARGRVRSKPLDDLIAEVTQLAEKGYKEIVLTGINLSAFGQDINLHLCDAVEAVCAINGIERVRLGSLEPEQLSEDVIIRLSKQQKLCPQFHLSLQSGCDETLKRMNRHYTTEEYRTIVQNLRNAFDNAAITTDIMVGFPGETEEDHQELFKHLLNEVELEEEEVTEDSQKFAGVNFVITGSVEHFANRAEVKAEIEKRGGKVTGSVTSKTNYLINNDVNSTSSKNKKARDLGVPIISEKDFLEML